MPVYIYSLLQVLEVLHLHSVGGVNIRVAAFGSKNVLYCRWHTVYDKFNGTTAG